LNELAHKLESRIGRLTSVAVAFSGGVDSAVVAAASHQALGSMAVAITGVGDALATAELNTARDIAAIIGIRHIEIQTSEIQDLNYIRNDARRCYHCKSNLYRAMHAWAEKNGPFTLISGTNADDLSDYRPGLEAANEHGVIAPLAEMSIGKDSVRSLARHYGLPVADKPASPCLASRIAYGQSVTTDRLRRIEASEGFLKELGFSDVRVRVHEGELARIEIPTQEWARANELDIRKQIATKLQSLGFQFVTIDLMGRQSGSLNRMLPILQ
jgi:uncharacterized protein